MAHDVFISYASEDKPIADALCATLEGRKIRCWIAPRDIMAGANWGEAIMEGISGSRVMVLVFSSHANKSPQVMREVERAVSRGQPIVPFRVEKVEPTKAMEYYISAPHWLDALSPPLERHMKTLAEMVEVLLEKADRAKPGDAGAGAGGAESEAARAWRSRQDQKRIGARRWTIAVISAVVLAAVAWAGYVLFGPDEDQQGEGGVAIHGGSEAASDSNVSGGGGGGHADAEPNEPARVVDGQADEESSNTTVDSTKTDGEKDGGDDAVEEEETKPAPVPVGDVHFDQGSTWFGTFQLSASTDSAEMIMVVTWRQGEEFKGFMLFPQQSAQQQDLSGTVRGNEVVFTVNPVTYTATLAGDRLEGTWSNRRPGEGGAIALVRNAPAKVPLTTQTVWVGDAGVFQSTERKPMIVEVTWVGEGGQFTGGVYWPGESLQAKSISADVYDDRVVFELQGTRYTGVLSDAGITGRWFRGPQSQDFVLRPARDAGDVVVTSSRWEGRLNMPKGEPPQSLTITLGTVTAGGQIESGIVLREGDAREGQCTGVILGDRVLMSGGRNLVLYGTVEGQMIRGEWRQGSLRGMFELARR